ncbi:MAG: response regulator [Pseudomonadota bacterium]
MANADIPIMVVDDARFSSSIIARILGGAGFTNVRYTDSPFQALRSLERQPADILLANWHNPSMDALELTRRAKLLDATSSHRTHVLALTGEEDLSQLDIALAAGIDDFIPRDQVRAQLASRVLAAERLTARHNDLVAENARLNRRLAQHGNSDLIDPATGLGNFAATIGRLERLLEEVRTRGGGAFLLMIGVGNLADIEERHSEGVVEELLRLFAARLQSLVRPLDEVFRIERDLFVLPLKWPIEDEDRPYRSFRRLYDSLYMHSFETAEGFIPTVVGVSGVLAQKAPERSLPTPHDLLRAGFEGNKRSLTTGVFSLSDFKPSAAKLHEYRWADLDA